MIKNAKESLGRVFQTDAPMISNNYLKKQVSEGDAITKSYNVQKKKICELSGDSTQIQRESAADFAGARWGRRNSGRRLCCSESSSE